MRVVRANQVPRGPIKTAAAQVAPAALQLRAAVLELRHRRTPMKMQVRVAQLERHPTRPQSPAKVIPRAIIATATVAALRGARAVAQLTCRPGAKRRVQVVVPVLPRKQPAALARSMWDSRTLTLAAAAVVRVVASEPL